MPIADPAGADEMTARWDQAKLDELLDGMSRIEFMVRFTIAEPALDTTNIGTQNLDHLRDNVAAVRKGPLPANLVGEAKRRLDATGSRPVQARSDLSALSKPQGF
jgi:aryl-alcohol dehydrogenase-like predicted oxidoreductase